MFAVTISFLIACAVFSIPFWPEWLAALFLILFFFIAVWTMIYLVLSDD